MRQPFTELYVHLVWATWDRLPLITPEIKDPLYASIQAKCTELHCEVLAMNGVEDHLHLLVRLPAALAVSDLVKHVKGASSHLIAQKLNPAMGFKWQGAYGAFTLSKAELPRIINYIARQQEHHREQTLMSDFETTALTHL